jgi:prolyl 4-hydroxylase
MVDEIGRITHEDVTHTDRTSMTAFCSASGGSECPTHATYVKVTQRILEMLGLQHSHAEHMQLLKYEPGEFYKVHHDWMPAQVNALCGPRVYTFFLYLSDVEEGGGTHFPLMNVTVTPKKGSAVWWPHGFSDNPWRKDERTTHEAMPVLTGLKYAANFWVHGAGGGDFKSSLNIGCVGHSGFSNSKPTTSGSRVWRK